MSRANNPSGTAGLTRRSLLKSAAGIGATLGISSGQAAPPNIVFVLADDLGWADLGCYGADLHETPNIDRLARLGVRFTDAYAAAPVCSPTRASILIGKYPARLHMTTWLENAENPATDRKLIPPVTVANLPHAEVTVAEALHGSGYLNALVGKWHLGTAGFYPETQGFDVNIGGTLWGAPQTYFYPYSGSRRYQGEIRYVPHLEFGKPGEYLTDRLTDEALKVVDGAGNQPFLLYLAHHAVHTPLEARPRDVAYFASRIKPGMKHTNATYAAMTRSLDQSVGRVLRRLQERGLARNTIVIFASDNGGAIQRYDDRPITNNAPLRSGKGALYEGGVRVPLMVYWPGVTPPGGVSHEPVVSMDLFATILEMAGLKNSAAYAGGHDGLSLAPLLRDPAAHLPARDLYFHYPHYYPTTGPVSALRSGRWKLLEYLEDGHLELYDLETDPGETRDLAPSDPARAAELRERLRAWRTAVNAQMPRPNPAYRPQP
jgi:arylsulfatase A